MLLGRVAEQRRIGELVQAVRSGRSAVLVLMGEPGVGKTALLERAVDLAAGLAILRTRGVEAEAELPFAGLSDLLRPATVHLGDIPQPQSSALAGALGIGPQVPGDPFTTFLATFSLLSRAAEDRPLLVAVDDVQWLDQSSQDAILFTARRLAAEGIGMLLATRPEFAERFSDQDIPIMRIEGLDPTDAARLLRREASRRVNPEAARRLAAETRGNPLALQELSRMLTADQLDGTEELPDPLPVGRDLRTLFLPRIGSLPARTRQGLLVASASGHGEPAVIGAALTAVGLELADLEPAEAAGVVSLDAELQFSHPLLRAAIYHDASPADRRRAHAALAEVMSGPEAAARRSWHLAAATMGPDESVAAIVEASGHDARARGAHAVAASIYRRAAELTPMPEMRVPRVLAAAMEHVLAGQPVRALPLLDDAQERVVDPGVRAGIDHVRGRVLMNVGPLTRAQEVLSVGAGAIEETAPAQAASMLSEAALTASITGDVQRGEDYARRAVKLTGGRDDGPGEINHIIFTGMLVLAGKATEAEPHVERERTRIRAMRAADEWQLVALNAIWLMWAEEYELARAVLDAAVDEARRTGAVGLLPLPLAQRADLSWRVGEGSAAYTLSDEAVRLAADTSQAVTVAYAGAIQALVLAGQGRESECRASAELALASATPVGADSAIGRCEAALGLLELGAGRYTDAVRHLRTAHEVLEAQGVGEPTVVQYEGDFIEALLRAGQIAEAEDMFVALETRAAATARNWTRAIIARARGMLSSDGEFVSHFDEAIRWHDALPGRFDRARTLLACGERLRRVGQRGRARQPLREALHEFERVGAAGWAARARAELRATGAGIGKERRSDLGSLTAQELQIAMAVANGLTNREVAAALFVSPKTVEFHLGNVYSKLALRSRTELVRLVAARA